MKNFAALIFGTLCMLAAVFAQQLPPASTAASKPPIQMETSSAETSALKEQNLILKEQIKVIREYHSSLMDTVYWSLTALATAAGILLTVNFFSAWRTRVSDRNLLTSEFDAKSSRLSEELNKKISAVQIAATESFSSRSDALLDRISQDFVGLRQELAADKASAVQSFEKLDDDLRGLGEKLLANKAAADLTQNALHLLEASLRTFESEFWEVKDYAPLMIMSEAQGVKAAAKGGSDFLVERGLMRIKATIEKYFAAGSNRNIRAESVKMILNDLPKNGKHEPLASEVRALVENLPLYKEPGLLDPSEASGRGEAA